MLAAAGVVTATVVAVALLSPAPVTAAPVTAGTLHWTRCESSDLRAGGAVCATLAVPMDHNRPSGPQVHLALAMVRHTVAASAYQGVLLTNPGGPGVSGIGLATAGEDLPGHVSAAYDWVGWDPRGVGASTPTLRCNRQVLAGPRRSYHPTTTALERYWRHRAHLYANACARHGGALLHHLSTADSARDMESIRVAMGQEQISFYGYSYGTYLGEVYASRYPTRVRRAVFDSTVDPRGIWYVDNLGQDAPIERNMRIWFGWVARHHRDFHLGRSEATVRGRYRSVAHALRAHPAGRVVGPDEWSDLLVGAAYYQSTWPELGTVFSDWYHHHDATLLVSEYRSAESVGDDNAYAAYLATECTDASWPSSWSRWRVDTERVAAKAPYVSWSNTMHNLPCLYWKAHAHHTVTVDGSGVASLLLVDQTLDAATPYGGSIEVRRRFPTARLLAVPGGTSHAVSPGGGTCVARTVARYLTDGTLPARVSGDHADATCPAPAQPE